MLIELCSCFGGSCGEYRFSPSHFPSSLSACISSSLSPHILAFSLYLTMYTISLNQFYSHVRSARFMSNRSLEPGVNRPLIPASIIETNSIPMLRNVCLTDSKSTGCQDPECVAAKTWKRSNVCCHRSFGCELTKTPLHAGRRTQQKNLHRHRNDVRQ